MALHWPGNKQTHYVWLLSLAGLYLCGRRARVFPPWKDNQPCSSCSRLLVIRHFIEYACCIQWWWQKQCSWQNVGIKTKTMIMAKFQKIKFDLVTVGLIRAAHALLRRFVFSCQCWSWISQSNLIKIVNLHNIEYCNLIKLAHLQSKQILQSNKDSSFAKIWILQTNKDSSFAKKMNIVI